jgi:hypothetical protein
MKWVRNLAKNRYKNVYVDAYIDIEPALKGDASTKEEEAFADPGVQVSTQTAAKVCALRTLSFDLTRR